MRYFFYLIVSLVFLSSSCRKEPNTSSKNNNSVPPPSSAAIQGHVIENGTNKPVAGALVHLSAQLASLSTTWPKEVAYATTDANGFFSLGYKLSRDSGYTLKAEKQYYSSAEANVDPWQHSNITVPVFPVGWIHFYILYRKGGQYAYVSSNLNRRVRAPKDSNFVLGYGGNAKNRIIYITNDYHQDTKYTDSVFVPALDTVIYNIEY